MADVSKIKLPNGTTYDIKDTVSGYTTNTGTITKVQTTAGAHTTINVSSGAATFNVPTKTSHLTNDSGFITNAGVTGVKGNAESSYRTGQVNLTAANIGAIAKTDELQTTNPFAPNSLRGPYISKIDNAFYAADKRWVVTASNGADVSTLFDGSYETNFVVADGQTATVTMDFTSDPYGYFPGYPYGYMLVSFYYTASPASISCRAYCNYEPHGIGWFDIPLTPMSDNTSGANVYRGRQGRYNISKIEFTIVAKTTSDYRGAYVNQIEMHLDRPDSMRNPFLSKYGPETLYYDLTAPNFIGNLTGNVTGNVSGSAGSVAWSGVSSKPTTLSGYGITDAKISSGTITLGSNTITPLTSSSTLNAAKLSGAIPSAVTATTQASTDNSTKIATTAYVTTAIANLPEPMIFKGSVGTGGTVTSLPTAAASNEGWTYKVITALSSPAAKVGDTVISNGSSWVVIPSGDEPSGTVTSVAISNGGGLSVSGSPITSSGTITISHADTSSQASSSNSGRTYIQSITLDTYGHVTGISTATETVTDSDKKLQVAEVTSATQYYPIVGTGTTAATRQYDTTGFKYKGTTGTTSVVGSAILELGNSTASGTAGNKQGQLIVYGTNAKKATITLAAPSDNIALALPTSGGTLALASQIPSVPSATGSSTTGISIAAHGTGTVIGVQSTTTTASKVTVGSSSTDYGVKSAGSASTWTFEEKTIPNVTSAGTASSWTFEEKTIPNVTAAGSGSASLTFTMDTTDTKKLKITFSHTHTAPTIGTAIKVQSKSGGSNGTAPTLGTAIKVQSKSGGANSTAPTLGSKVPTVSASDVTVPIKNTSASTFVTGTTHTVTDNGHTHTI